MQTARPGVVDLSVAGARVPYEMTGVPPGTYQVWAWVDDNGDGNPLPSGGAPGSFPTCGAATVSATAGATVDLVFDVGWN